MDAWLKELFTEKGFSAEQVAEIQAKDSDLKTLSDLASGAASEEDARSWADELGLGSRVLKSRFVQTWLESKSRQGLLLGKKTEIIAAPAPASSSLAAPQPPSTASAARSQPVAKQKEVAPDFEESEEEIEPDWSWIKLNRPPPVEQSIVLSYVDDEPVSRPGGLTDNLRRSFRSSGLTSIEIGILEGNLEARSCKALATSAGTHDGAMRLARMAGVTSKVSQENFAKSWYEAATAMMALDTRSSPSKPSVPLTDPFQKKDFKGCTDILMRRCNVGRKKDLLSLVTGMLSHLAEKERLAETKPSSGTKQNSKLLPALAALYGEEAASEAVKATAVDEAEWRWRWTVKTLFTPKTALALQTSLLAAYQKPRFQAACEQLNNDWDSKPKAPPLPQKMRDIEALCMEHALGSILLDFGFSADGKGLTDMKEAVGQFTKTDPDVRRKQMEITGAVMGKFKL